MMVCLKSASLDTFLVHIDLYSRGHVSYVSAYIVTKSMFLWNMVLNLWISWPSIPKMWTFWSIIPKMWTLRLTISYLTVNIQGTSLEIHKFMWTF